MGVEMQYKLIDIKSYFFAIIVLFLSWILFAWESGQIYQTFFAALLTAALFWVSYVLVRLVVIAIKR